MGYNIRSSQLLSPFGIGQIVNFPGEQSYMICGLNLWDKMLKDRGIMGGILDPTEFIIKETRLQNLLSVENLRKPFPYKSTGQANINLEIPSVRFPQWHHCTNVKCGAMRKIELTQSASPECERCAEGKKMFKMIPVRFVAACPHGHIQDVPFIEWVHNGPLPQDKQSHKLSYHAGSGSGDLSSINIRCTCGAAKSLGGLMNVSKTSDGRIYNSSLAAIGLNEEEKQNIDHDNSNNENPVGQYCKGSRPWLGPDHMLDTCGSHLHVLIRGGSNIHYSDIISALYLPEFEANSNPTVGRIIDEIGIDKILIYYNQADDHSILRIILETRHEIINNIITAEYAFDEIEKILNNHQKKNINRDLNSEIELRYQEYRYIIDGRNSENSDFKSIVNNFDRYKEQELLEKYFERVVLIEKLKETRVFRSFARIDPENLSRIVDPNLSAEIIKWLPAIQVYGEGIFLQFKKESIDDWIQQFNSNYPLLERYQENIRTPNPRHEHGLSPVFVMMHTFAHLLIKRLCFNCGYGSSSLRERIYFNQEIGKEMIGILIYTSSGDSEGSLGGLVRQGKEQYLGNLIKEAVADAEWCSADPVCSDIGQSVGQGTGNVNGSACHNCCLVPETSCEEFNTLLDRSLIVGTSNKLIKGYFKS